MSEHISDGNKERIVTQAFETAQFLLAVVEPNPQFGVTFLELPPNPDNPQFEYPTIEAPENDDQSDMKISHRILGSLGATPDATVTYSFGNVEGRSVLYVSEELTDVDFIPGVITKFNQVFSEPEEASTVVAANVSKLLDSAFRYKQSKLRLKESLHTLTRGTYKLSCELRADSENINRSFWARLLGKKATSESITLAEALEMNRTFDKNRSEK